MRVEVLYVADCPSHPAAVELVKSILLAEGLDSPVHEVLVQDERMAQELRFRGSPTIRINGYDVGDADDGVPTATEKFAFSCRLYPGSQRAGLPSADLIQRAVAEARRVSGFALANTDRKKASGFVPTNPEPKRQVEP